jgi:nicotinic acid phosphoribosyltransferase
MEKTQRQTLLEQFLDATKTNCGEYDVSHQFRQEFNHNLGENWPEVQAIFNMSSTPELLASATIASDYYKLSMAPVLQAAQELAKGPVVVTFATEIREKPLAKRLLDNDGGIQNDLVRRLNDLSSRKFNRNVVLAAVEGKPVESFWLQNIDRICGPSHAPNTLIRAERLAGSSPADFHDGTVIYNRPVRPEEVADGQVAISVYVNDDSKGALQSDCSESRSKKLHIEATGNWSQVTFLETPMMQAVYQVVLADHLRKQRISFAKWLHDALFRCHLSITFAKTSCPAMKGALFAGRRTGHHLFTLLQTWYASRFYPNCIGTSSMDAWYTLSRTLGMSKIVPPVGTHAHELSMVFMSLFPKLDENVERIQFSQALAHSMYYRLVHQGYAGPMPMLPDTLGTTAFLKAAEACKITPMINGEKQLDAEKVSLLSVMNSARQDSGKLAAFKRNLSMYPFNGTMMASEIDTKEDLVEAAELGYVTFGAGGFMGDSEKVWNVTADKFSASMAVKAVRVFVDGRRTAVQPVKLGDSEDASKMTCDAALPLREYTKIVEAAKGVRSAAVESQHTSLVLDLEPILDSLDYPT